MNMKFTLRVVLPMLLLAQAPLAMSAPDIEIEIAKQQLVQTIKAQNWTDMLARTKALRAKKVDLGTEILFFEGRGLKELGRPDEAEAKLTEYVKKSGGKGSNYGTALEYLSALRGEKQAREQARRAANAHAAALREWTERGAIGEVTELNSEWGFIRIRIDRPDRVKLPLQLRSGDHAVSLGELREVGANEYTVGVPAEHKGAAPGQAVYTCCRPELP